MKTIFAVITALLSGAAVATTVIIPAFALAVWWKHRGDEEHDT